MSRLTFDDKIRAARPIPPRAYEDMLEATLSGLAVAAGKKHVRWLPYAAAAAALLVALTLAGPPAARAAAAFLEKLFAGRAAAIEQELARPAAERIGEIAEEYRAQSYYFQTFDAPFTPIGDIQATVYGVSVSKAEGGAPWRVALTVRYAQDVEGFDPAWLDYTLTVGGQDIPMNMDDGTRGYRREGLVGRPDSMMSPWQVMDGYIESYASFDVGALPPDGLMDMRLSAQLHTRAADASVDRDIGRMELPFTFDAAVAEAQEKERIAAALPAYDQYLSGERERYAALAAQAVPVGARYEEDGQAICVEEMAVADGRVVLTVSASGAEDYASYRKARMLVTGMRVDGMAMPLAGSEDILSSANNRMIVARDLPLARDVRKLPEESLIYVEFDADVGTDAGVVYRYNWTRKAVTLPADVRQARAWRDEEEAMRKAAYTEPFLSLNFKPNATQTKGGATLTIDEIQIDTMMRLRFSLAGREMDKNDYDRDYAVTVDGLPALDWSGKGLDSYDFIMPVHQSEIGDTVALTLSIPVAFADGGSETFTFDLILDTADAERLDRKKEKN